MKRRKEIYEAMHQGAKRGQAQAIGMNKALGNNVTNAELVTSFVDDTASKMNVHPETIRRDVQIASNINNDVKDQIRGTEIEDNKRALLEIARMDPEQQRQVAPKIKSGEIKTVADVKKEASYYSLSQLT